MNRHSICIIAGLAIALSGCTAADPAAVTEAMVTRDVAGGYALAWKGANGPVDVFVADRADAPRKDMRLLVDNDADGRAEVKLDGAARPYFFVAADGGGGVWTAERLLPLEGGRNFRDIGGYATADGRHVKWGRVFRSGSMASLTPADYRYLDGLGIRTVCDLRTNGERTHEPNAWAKAAGIGYWTRDYEKSGGDLGKLVSPDTTAARMKQAMVAMYRRLPEEQADGYREIFRQLAAGDVPLAFNCSAGKDRAGTAAALILSALGVPDETVFADYALSDRMLARSASHRMMAGDKDSPWAALATLPRAVLAPLMASDPDYIRAAFAAIREKHQSVDNYLRDELGVTPDQLAAIRASLLE